MKIRGQEGEQLDRERQQKASSSNISFIAELTIRLMMLKSF